MRINFVQNEYVERGHNVYTKIIFNCKSYTLQYIALDKIPANVIIYNDDQSNYNELIINNPILTT